MFEASSVGLWGAIIGCAIGAAGGIFGTWISISRTPAGPKRSFMWKMGVIGWLGISLFLALIFTLPANWNLIAWIIYPPCLVFWIQKMNKRLRNTS
ncbi:MAG: hypothetical protein HOC21_01290 [Phycisphaerae bacterium]|nr:hypothetical protein [Phycisphaerae bacterium]